MCRSFASIWSSSRLSRVRAFLISFFACWIAIIARSADLELRVLLIALFRLGSLRSMLWISDSTLPRSASSRAMSAPHVSIDACIYFSVAIFLGNRVCIGLRFVVRRL